MWVIRVFPARDANPSPTRPPRSRPARLPRAPWCRTQAGTSRPRTAPGGSWADRGGAAWPVRTGWPWIPRALGDVLVQDREGHVAQQRGQAIPTVQLGAGGWERHETVPVFDSESIDQLGTQLCPAASPQLRRRPSSWPSRRHAKPATKSAAPEQPRNGRALHPGPYPPDLSRRLAYGALTTGSCRIPSDLARRTQPVWQYQAVPALSALLPTLPVVSRIRLRSAAIGLLRQPDEKVFHLLQLRAPHGAPCGSPSSGSLAPSALPILRGPRRWVGDRAGSGRSIFAHKTAVPAQDRAGRDQAVPGQREACGAAHC